MEGPKKNYSEESKNIPSVFGSRQNHFWFPEESKSSSHNFVQQFKTLLIYLFSILFSNSDNNVRPQQTITKCYFVFIMNLLYDTFLFIY